uniref:ribose-phosphate diphosphokinase n=1 Tax=Aegilops tauschii TaxID=37682 RepID=M8BV61_AEGTA
MRCQRVDPVRLRAVNGSPPCVPLSDRSPWTPATMPIFGDANIRKDDTRLRIFSGTANPSLAQEIASYMGLELGKVNIKRFADGEIYVQLQESVRGCNVFLVQPSCPPANENLMELLIMIDACRRASAKNITAVIPYFGYARADRKIPMANANKLNNPTLGTAHRYWVESRALEVYHMHGYLRKIIDGTNVVELGRTTLGAYLPMSFGWDLMVENEGWQSQGRESIAAKLVANMITEAGANRVLVCDLHSSQAMGYFDIPVDHVYGQPVILDYLASKTISSNDLVVVSPDVGGVARARAFAKKLSDAPLAIVDKRRHGHNVAEASNSQSAGNVMNLIGDVRGKVAVMMDDMIDTAGTIAKGAELLHQEGAREVYACCTHAVFSPPAIERLSSGLFQEVIITNTIPLKEEKNFPQLTILSVANLLGETIWRVHDDCSVGHAPYSTLDID